MKKQSYHKQLKLMYSVQEDGILFQDDIFYSNEEINILKNNPGFDHVIIHEAKKIFDGEFVENV